MASRLHVSTLISELLFVIALLCVHTQIFSCARLCPGDQIQRLEDCVRYWWRHRQMCTLCAESILVSRVGYCDGCALWWHVRVRALYTLSLWVSTARIFQVTWFLSGGAISCQVTVNRTTHIAQVRGQIEQRFLTERVLFPYDRLGYIFVLQGT